MKFKNLTRRWGLFGATVVIPTLLAAVYFGAVASNTYVSESRFVVRAAERPEGMGGLGALFKGFTTAGSENVLLVRDYLLSRELIRALDTKLGLRDAYGEGDILTRFPAPFTRNSYEEFFEYYPKKVRIEVDPQSSVGVLTVRGYDPAQVQVLNKLLLDAATVRIRSLNAQIRTDSLGIAERELGRARDRLIDAERAIAAARVAQGVVDPEQQAGLELRSEQELRGQLAASRARLSQIRAIAPQSPQIPALRAEVDSITASIATLQREVTGAGAGSRASASPDFSGLLVEREIAVKTVAATNEALVRARVDAERRHLYLEMVSAPTLPDDALHPQRLKSVIATLLIGLLAYLVLSMLLTGAREHTSSR